MRMEINEIIGKNLADLRKKNNMTQREVAYKLDFSDKSVSKWESGESMPSVDVLCKLANLYSVRLDYLVTEEHENNEDVVEEAPEVAPIVQHVSRYRYSRLIISLLSILAVWVAAVCLFVFTQNDIPTMWIAFVWAIPASFVLAIIFNSLWGKVYHTFVYISLLLWTALGSVFVQLVLCGISFWQVFLIGAPLQLGVILAGSLVLKNKSHDPATIRAKREYKKEIGQKRKEKLAEKKAKQAELKAKKHEKDEIKEEVAQQEDNRQMSFEEINPTKQKAEESKTTSLPPQTKPFNKTKNEKIIQDL